MKPEVAKFRVMNKHPFFGTILFNLPVVEEEAVGTMGVDGETLFINRKFWDKLTPQQQMGTMMHEAGHLFLQHLWRGRNAKEVAVDPITGQMVSLFNMAGDFVINLMIKDDPRFDLPKGHLCNEKYKGWSTEDVYRDLLKSTKRMSKKDLQNLIKSAFCDKSKWGKGKGQRQQREMQAKWNQIAKQAMEAAKQRGSIPEFLKRMFEHLEPKEDWRAVLQEYVQPFNMDYSFNPSDRRFLEDEFVLPDISDGSKVDYIVVAVDTSGSIGNKELNSFIGEIKGIMESFDKVKVKLTFCDAEATPFTELNEFDPKQIKPVGGGGTDFAPVFKITDKEETPPLALIYLTDLMGSFPRKTPDYDVIWVNSENKKEKVPFGRVLPYKV